MTTDDVMQLRHEVGFVTPITPLEPGGDLWCVSERPGHIEFMVHPDDAFRYLALGFPLGGELRKCAAVGVWPLVNAIQICVYDRPHAPGLHGLPGCLD